MDLLEKWTTGNKIEFVINAKVEWEKWGKEDEKYQEKAKMYQKDSVSNKRKRDEEILVANKNFKYV